MKVLHIRINAGIAETTRAPVCRTLLHGFEPYQCLKKKMGRMQCNAGSQEFGRCCVRGESEEYVQGIKHVYT